MQREQALQKKMGATSPSSDDVSRKKARKAESLNLEGTSPPLANHSGFCFTGCAD